MAGIKTAIAAIGLASLVSASAKADMFSNVPDYSANNTAYAEQETPIQESASLYGTAAEAPSLEAVSSSHDLFGAENLQIPAREITVEDYLSQNNIDFNSEYTTSWWEYPINIAGGFMLTLVWHEFGHYAMANIFGAEDVQMHIFDGECNGDIACVTRRAGVCRDMLCRSIDYDLGQLQETLVSAAGMGFTTIGNVSLTSLLENDLLPDWARSFTATTSLMMMIDRHRYIWGSAIKKWAGIGSETDDIAHIINRNFSSSEAREAAYGVLVAASAIEIALRWEEVWYLMNTIAGRQVEVPEGLGVMPGLYPYGSNIMLGASGEF